MSNPDLGNCFRALPSSAPFWSLRCGNLWYLNFSDRPAGRITGMTRFAASRELLLDPSTYGERSTSSARLPAALLRALRFTL